jgi:hypothetical protein
MNDICEEYKSPHLHHESKELHLRGSQVFQCGRMQTCWNFVYGIEVVEIFGLGILG